MHKPHIFYSNDISLLEVCITTSKILLWQAKYLKSLKCLFAEVQCNAMQSDVARVFTQAPAVDVHTLKKTFNSSTVVQWALMISALESIFSSIKLDWGYSQNREWALQQGQLSAGIERARTLNWSEFVKEWQKLLFPFLLKTYRPHTAQEQKKTSMKFLCKQSRS